MIKDIERGKSDIFEMLKDVLQSPHERAKKFVELLEDKSTLDDKLSHREVSKNYRLDQIKYTDFCKAYIIYVFNHFIVSSDDIEIMFLAFNYLPAFEHFEKITSRRDAYARQVYELKHPDMSWGDKKSNKNRGLLDQEMRIMKKLSELLAELAVKQGGTLDLVEEVLAALEPPNTEENDDTPEEIDEDTAPPSGDDPPPCSMHIK